MFCPYCSTRILETSESCPQCSFAIHEAEKFFGDVPQLSLGINDRGGALNPEDTGAIMSRLHQLSEKYPQIRFAIVTVALKPETPLPALATWLFNRAGLFHPSERGGMNRGILIALDTAGEESRASIQTGYGLEPFLGYHHLQGALEAAGPAFANGSFGRGILAIISEVERILDEVYAKLEKTYGINLAEIRPSEARRIGLSVPTQEAIISTASGTRIDEY